MNSNSLHVARLLLASAAFSILPRAAFCQPNEDPSPVIVTITQMHICCDRCVKQIEQAATIGGVQVQVLKNDEAVQLTADGYDDAQRAIDALAKAGFYGSIEDDTQMGKLEFPPIRTPQGNVTKLVVRHINNCCSRCSQAIVAAIESVDGVTSNTVKSKAESFVVEGNFSAGAVVTALEEAGFYPTIQ